MEMILWQKNDFGMNFRDSFSFSNVREMNGRINGLNLTPDSGNVI